MKKNNISFSKRDHIKYLVNKYCSNITGIINKNFFLTYKTNPNDYLNEFSADMPFYERLIYKNENAKISYHLSGYSQDLDDALIRLLGESFERYSAVMASIVYKDELKSYDDLTNELRLPNNLFDIYSNKQKEIINNINKSFSLSTFNKNECKYIKLKNYFDKKYYFVPMQSFFITGHIYDQNILNFSFTTGTSMHTNLYNSMVNSIIEQYQVHIFMKFWYFKSSKLFLINENDIKTKFKRIYLNNNKIQKHFFYIKDELEGLFTIFCFLVSDEFHYYSIGVQSDLSLDNAIIRAYEEAETVRRSSQMRILTEPELFNVNININDNEIIDLDNNVLYWALDYKSKPSKYFKKLYEQAKKINYEILISCEQKLITLEDKLNYLINDLRTHYKYIFIKDITSPELADDFYVIRVYIPEMFTIFLPSFPPMNHDYIQKHGLELRDEFIVHPMP